MNNLDLFFKTIATKISIEATTEKKECWSQQAGDFCRIPASIEVTFELNDKNSILPEIKKFNVCRIHVAYIIKFNSDNYTSTEYSPFREWYDHEAENDNEKLFLISNETDILVKCHECQDVNADFQIMDEQYNIDDEDYVYHDGFFVCHACLFSESISPYINH